MEYQAMIMTNSLDLSEKIQKKPVSFTQDSGGKKTWTFHLKNLM